jgi:hypothetical protein
MMSPNASKKMPSLLLIIPGLDDPCGWVITTLFRSNGIKEIGVTQNSA